MDETPERAASEAQALNLDELENRLGYRFHNLQHLMRALTHRSFVNEQESRQSQDNESVEFLGDAVLGFLISAKIFDRFPDMNEGELSKIKAFLVSAANLVHLAEKIQLGEFILLSKGEEKTGGRNKRAILVDAYEALLGALYLDGGVEAARDFLDRQIGSLLDSLDPRQLTYGDFKSALQEQLHDMARPVPVYRVVDEIGPDHRKVFVVEVVVGGAVVARSSGTTKKEAQQEAARLALENLKIVLSAES